MDMIKRFGQIKNLNDGLSTLMVLCMTVYQGGYSKKAIESAFDGLVDKTDYEEADRDAIITSMVNLSQKSLKNQGSKTGRKGKNAPGRE